MPIARFIEETTGDAVLIEDGSLYPALYRLERHGWVEAEWGTSELGRRAKLYRITAAGRAQLAAEMATWRRFAAGVSKVFRDMKRSLRSWLWRVPIDQEVDEEIALHLELRTRELIDGGMDPARRASSPSGEWVTSPTSNELVNVGRKRDRELSMTLWLEELRDDVMFAVRQLRTAPVFTLVAVTTLALGIGANSAIFALVDATLLRPLPYAEPDRLVTIWETTATNNRSFASPPNMLDWSARSRTFESIAGFTPDVGGMVMAGRDGNAETVSRQWVTGRHLRRARREANRRPHVPRLKTKRSAPTSSCSARRSGRRASIAILPSSAPKSGSTDCCGRSSASCQGVRDSGPHQRVGDAVGGESAAAGARRVRVAGRRPHEGRGRHGRGAVRPVGGGKRPRR